MKKNKIIGIILILIAILLPIGNYFTLDREEKVSEAKIISYLKVTSLDSETDISRETNDKYDYLAILEIPVISLKKGLVDINSKYNDIKYNVAIMESSQFPDVINSNLILASHNGNSNASFFKDLENLVIGDSIYLYYNGYKYIYHVDNFYIIEKNGTANIVRDSEKTTITLITCKDNSDTEQIIYIGYLIDKEEY